VIGILIAFNVDVVRDSIYFDYSNNKVYILKTYRGVVIDTFKILTFEEYFNFLSDSLFYAQYQKFSSSNLSNNQSGLIPTISVPIDIPVGLGFLGGNEAKLTLKEIKVWNSVAQQIVLYHL